MNFSWCNCKMMMYIEDVNDLIWCRTCNKCLGPELITKVSRLDSHRICKTIYTIWIWMIWYVFVYSSIRVCVGFSPTSYSPHCFPCDFLGMWKQTQMNTKTNEYMLVHRRLVTLVPTQDPWAHQNNSWVWCRWPSCEGGPSVRWRFFEVNMETCTDKHGHGRNGWGFYMILPFWLL